MDRLPLQEERLMHRFYADPDCSDAELFRLDDADTRHAVKVLRLQPGDLVEVIFGGRRYLAQIRELSPAGVSLFPTEELPSTEPRLSLTLFQGLPKSDKMDWIVQKSVELGVSRIVPVLFSRCVVHPDVRESGKKLDRWRKIAREAGKQSGRCVVPEILSPVSFSSLPGLLSGCEKVAVPWENCPAGGPLSFFSRHPSLSSLGIVIGPEGGISGEEADALLCSGCETVTLGPRILRTETAGLAAASVFFGLYGEME